jgi:hypothetical protein
VCLRTVFRAVAVSGGGGGAGWRCEDEECKWVGFHKDPRR